MSVPNLSGLTQVSLFQQDDPIRVHHKETSQQVLDVWEFEMTKINAIIDLTGTPPSAQITEAMRANFQTALQNMVTFAKFGFTYDIEISPGPPPVNKTVTDRITVEMAQDLDNLLRTIESAHPGAQFTGGIPTISIEAVRAWRDFAEATPVIKQIVQHMNSARAVGGVWNDNGTYLDGVVNSRGILQVGSLQSMIELLYVKTGNELLADNLESLESALRVNQNALESLTSLQGMHNQIAAFSKGKSSIELGVQYTGFFDASGIPIIPASNSNDPPTEPPPVAFDANGNDNKAVNAYAKDGGLATTFFEAITPRLAPGMASIYDVMDAFNKANTALSSLGYATKVTNAYSALVAAEAALANPSNWLGPETGSTVRSNLVKAIKEYNEVIIPFNSFMEEFKKQLQPYIELLGLKEGEKFSDKGIGGPIASLIPVQTAIPPIPPFTSSEIPYPSTGSANGATSTAAELTAFRAQINAFLPQLSPLINPSIPALLPTTYSPLTFTQIAIDTFAKNLYSGVVINGDPSKSLSPIANIDMAIKIQQQYVLLNQQIDELALQSNQSGNPNSLLAKLTIVRNDLKNAGIESLSFISAGAIDSMDAGTLRNVITGITDFANKWIIDGLANQSDSFSGKIQENLGSAITSAQSLNDQQKEETRRFLFLFEEFYKSASAILTKITQILEKMAQNINR